MPIKSRWSEPIPVCSLQKWLFGSPKEHLPHRKAFIDPEQPNSQFLTYHDYRLYSKRIAAGLRAAGLQAGDRVLLISANHIYYPVLFMGVIMAGGIFTGASPGFVQRELAFQLQDSGARFMIAAQDVLPTAIGAAAQVGLPVRQILRFDGNLSDRGETIGNKLGVSTNDTVPRHWSALLASEEDGHAFVWEEPGDAKSVTCCLNYSSGTTATPKGVEITHYNYIANGIGVDKVAKLREDYDEFIQRSSALCFLPMYHSFGQTYFVVNFPFQGIPVYVMPSFHFLKMLSYIQHFRINHVLAVPPIFIALCKHPQARKFDLTCVEFLASGAAPLAKKIAYEAASVINQGQKDGAIVRQGWGMTEVTCTCMAWDVHVRTETLAVGEVMPNCQAKLMSLETPDEEVTTARTRGELWVAGPTIMRGYWNNEKETAATLVTDKEGTVWLRTGDVALVEEYELGALFHIVDRVKELIKVKGFQVAPAELEALLLSRDDVADVAVVGAYVNGNELPRAYVVLKAGMKGKARAEDFQRWMEERVTRYKWLQGGVAFVPEIPKNPAGKIMRKELRERAKKELTLTALNNQAEGEDTKATNKPVSKL